MFDPDKCPKCGKTTEVEHYDTGWRVICPCGYYGVFHFDEKEQGHVRNITHKHQGINQAA